MGLIPSQFEMDSFSNVFSIPFDTLKYFSAKDL